jgi:Fe-S-cluster containining protein
MQNCNQCGKCCIKYGNGGLSASAEEIDWWENHRPEIAKYVSRGKIWMDPTSGKQLTACPFLTIESPQSHTSTAEKITKTKYTCSIYYDRPDDCKYYPVKIDEMVRDGCEMIELSDLTDTRSAQITLDRIMSDSRPASDPTT